MSSLCSLKSEQREVKQTGGATVTTQEGCSNDVSPCGFVGVDWFIPLQRSLYFCEPSEPV